MLSDEDKQRAEWQAQDFVDLGVSEEQAAIGLQENLDEGLIAEQFIPQVREIEQYVYKRMAEIRASIEAEAA